ncbi:MAG: chromosomal replication initiator protein DnaA [Candidatus Dojkabacteria bacterium]|nr:chromosomal replication initiator protein DnaA [Candidatus Dojkabacteria bacterium]
MPDTFDSTAEGFNRPRINMDETWKIALEQIQLHVSPQNFIAWFKNTTLSRIENGIATIECPNAFAKEWLDSNHSKLLTTILRTITKQPLDIVFAIASDNARSAPAEAESFDRYQEMTLSPEDAPIFNIPFTHQNLVEEAQAKASLNRSYLFETFVVGPSNRIAHAAAEAVAENLGRSYNPLFVHGGVGLGKTHLVQAIGNRVLNNDPNKKVLYVSSETFLNEMIESIRNSRTSEFRGNYRKLDMLIIDDIQFFSEWQRAQEELFHTYNTLFQAGKQIVFISDRPPKQIDNLMDRLRSRLEGGMVADISEPDYELRIAIVRQKAIDKGILLPDHILDFVARSFSDNIRELEGALIRIGTHVKISGIVPDESGVAKILKIDPASKRKKTSPRELIQEVCTQFNVSIRDVRGSRRTADFVMPRQVCMYLLRKELALPLEQIAKELNRSDHTTVLHAIERVEMRMEEDREFKSRVEGVKVG